MRVREEGVLSGTGRSLHDFGCRVLRAVARARRRIRICLHYSPDQKSQATGGRGTCERDARFCFELVRS